MLWIMFFFQKAYPHNYPHPYPRGVFLIFSAFLHLFTYYTAPTTTTTDSNLYLSVIFHRKELYTIMKIICSKSQFLRGVNIVSKAVSNKTTMEILECILIEAFDDCIKLTANDTELGIETTIQGEIIVPGKIIKKIPDNDVILETEENGNTSIRCEQIHCNIMGKQGDDFSHLPEITKENKITISQYDLKEIIRQTIFSVSYNENNK